MLTYLRQKLNRPVLEVEWPSHPIHHVVEDLVGWVRENFQKLLVHRNAATVPPPGKIAESPKGVRWSLAYSSWPVEKLFKPFLFLTQLFEPGV